MLDSEMLKIVNSSGEMYLLHPNYEEFGVLAIEGLEPPETNVSMSETGTFDGSKYNSSHVESRTIVLYIVIFGWNESQRKKLYRMFPLKSAVELYYRNSMFNVKTNGYVKSMDLVHFHGKERARVELICPDPYFHAVENVESTITGESNECTITNHADCNIGFHAVVSIDTEETPDLRLYTSHTTTADELRAHNLNWEIATVNEPHFYDLSDKTVNLYVKGDYIDESTYTRYYMDVDGWESAGLQGEHVLQFTTNRNLFSNNPKVEIEVLSISGESVTDLRRYNDSVTVRNQTSSIVFEKPVGFDIDTWQIKVLWGNPVSEKSYGVDYTITEHSTYIEIVKSSGDFQVGEIVHMKCYYSVSNYNVKNKTIDVYTTGTDNLASFADMIVPAFIQDYNPDKDALRVYMGNTQITNYAVSYVSRGSESTIGLFIKNGTINKELNYEVIHSISGLDIREYTDEQLDEGMLLVKNLKIENVTTEESMQFSNVKFQKGDKLDISTVPGNLHATVTESEWLEDGTSLLYDVIHNGTFFKIIPGDNVLKVTADTNEDFVSTKIEIEQLYGGV